MMRDGFWKVGCGLAECAQPSGPRGFYLVCVYGPILPSASMDVLYAKGKTCSGCSKNVSLSCEHALCTAVDEEGAAEVPSKNLKSNAGITSETENVEPKKINLTEELVDLMVEEHNQRREMVASGDFQGQPSAKQMLKLIWDEDYAAAAEEWVEGCSLEQRPSDQWGGAGDVNLAWTTAENDTDAIRTGIQTWVDEVKYFQHPNTCKSPPGGSCSRYINMMRDAFFKVGCGLALCPRKFGSAFYYLICLYGPPLALKPVYLDGPPCDGCPNACDGNLCEELAPAQAEMPAAEPRVEPGKEVPLNSDLIAHILAEHNEKRDYVAKGKQKRLPKAKNMPQLEWEAGYVKGAGEWAAGCDWRHRPPKEWGGGGAESLAMTPLSSTSADAISKGIQLWYDEVQWWYYPDNCEAPPGKSCGHFTNMMRDVFTKVGCGLAKCPNLSNIGPAYYLVCVYGPLPESLESVYEALPCPESKCPTSGTSPVPKVPTPTTEAPEQKTTTEAPQKTTTEAPEQKTTAEAPEQKTTAEAPEQKTTTSMKAKDCQVSEWQNWKECSASCGKGVKVRVRNVIRFGNTKGKRCPSFIETKPCKALPPCPTDCAVTDWLEVMSCGRDCQGLRVAVRAVVVFPSGGGKTCPELSEITKCSLQKQCKNMKN